MKQYTIKATVFLDGPFWVGLFERNDDAGFAVARTIFGNEPTDPELYEFLLNNYSQLKFTKPQDFQLIIKRKNYKRTQREVRKLVAKVKTGLPQTSHAQEVLRLELEKNKKLKKSTTKAEKEAKAKEQFLLKQAKKKKKLRGH